MIKPATETTNENGVYSNLCDVSTSLDGMVRMVFRDLIGGSPKDRAHIVMTAGNALALSSCLSTIVNDLHLTVPAANEPRN